MAELTFRDAVRSALEQEMERDERVVLLGEDVGPGGVFKTTPGLVDRFGRERVWDTPISEQAIVGGAMGAAMAGMRPVAEIMFSDFYATCWDQVANEIAKTRYMTGGQVTAAAGRARVQRRRRAGVRRPAQPVGGELGDVRARAEGRRARRRPPT